MPIRPADYSQMSLDLLSNGNIAPANIPCEFSTRVIISRAQFEPRMVNEFLYPVTIKDGDIDIIADGGYICGRIIMYIDIAGQTITIQYESPEHFSLPVMDEGCIIVRGRPFFVV